MSSERIGFLLAFGSAATFALSSLVAKWAYAMGFTAFSFSLGSSLCAVALMAPGLRRGRWRPPAGVRPAALAAYCLAGASSGLCFNLSLSYLDVSLATLLVFTYPAIVALGAWLWFGQRPTRLQASAVALALAGAMLTAGPVQGEVRLLGVVMAVGAALTHSLYMLLGERLMPAWDELAATAWARATNALIAASIAPAAVGALVHTGAGGWGFLLVAALIAAVLPFLFLMQGVARVGASRAAVVASAELPIALLLGRFVMGDRLSLAQGLGALLITAAALLIALPAPQPKVAGQDQTLD